jgi:hypothetical protein
LISAPVSANVFKAKNSLAFFSDQHRLGKFLKFILPRKMNFEPAVTNAHFAPLHRPLFGQIPSQPRRFSSAKSASVTSDISVAERSAGFPPAVPRRSFSSG